MEQFLFVGESPDGMKCLEALRKAAAFLGQHSASVMAARSERVAKRWRVILSQFCELGNGRVVEGTNLADWSPSGAAVPDVMAQHGYIGARVYSPSRSRGYLFAADEEGVQYFVAAGQASALRKEFENWTNGVKLWLLPSATREDDKAIPVLDAQLAD